MTAPRIISAWAILLHIRTGDVHADFFTQHGTNTLPYGSFQLECMLELSLSDRRLFALVIRREHQGDD